MGSSEMGANGEEGVHGMSEIVGPEAWLFVEAQRRDRQMRTEALPHRPDQRLCGGEATGGGRHIKLGPDVVEKPEVQLTGHFTADGVLDVREIEHHSVGIEAAGHGDNQFVVVTMARGQSTGAEPGRVVVC